jgi:pimeloyl-ACP methyl ester carboxylesterase
MTLLDQFVSLPGGRRISYDIYGHDAGRPAFCFHGLPGSRRAAALLSNEARAEGLTLVCPDRPGLGLSDPQPGRRFLDWPADVQALADHLGFSRFAVIGISGGCPYAAATAHALPERVTAAYLVSGIGPLDDREALSAMMPANRILFGLLRMFPQSTVGLAALARLAYGGDHFDWIVGKMLPSMPPADRDVLRPHGRIDFFAEDAREAFRQGSRGYAEDQALMAKPWGFRLEDIRVPVRLYHGEADRNVPVSMGRRMAALIPDCKAVFYPDEGHLAFVPHAEEIFSALAADAPPR